MPIWMRYLIVLITFLVASGAAYGYCQFKFQESSLTDAAQVRMTVSSFGDNLQKIPLLAPADLVGKGMDVYYAEYVHPDLLAKWKADPTNAPGRLTSSPWPDRVDITTATKNADGTYTVLGNVVDVANGVGGATTTDSYPVRFGLTKGPDGWQITDYAKL